jgi:sugar/nucleoside kinase (ribokinase family)
VVSVGVFVGLCTLDVVQQVDHLPGTNEKVTARGQVIAAGGPATNAAVTFAALGGRAVLITALGTGPAADIGRGDLHDHGVEIVDVAPNDHDRLSISSVVVIADTGERTVVSTDAGRCPVEKVPDIAPWLSAADVVLIDCHHPVLAEHAAENASRLDRALVVDAGRWRPVMADVLPHATSVICSSDFRYPGSADRVSSAHELVNKGIRDVVVTQGGEPVLWWSGGKSGSEPVPRVDAVDTSGAGDVFHGAYCYYSTLPDFDLRQRLGAAARVASVKCEHFGPRSWLRYLPAH